MKVAVIGCGYLGAVHAAAVASLGFPTVGIDIDAERIESLRVGKAPFHEPGFEQLLRDGIGSGTLTFTPDVSDIADCDVIFLGVGTPRDSDGGRADLSQVTTAVESIVKYMKSGALVVGKSTVPVGTADLIAARIESGGGSLIWNPEFLREGFAVRDTLDPDRIVYGVNRRSNLERLDDVYRSILDRGTRRIVTDFASAELIKVSANAFLATKISFINSIAEIADATGADITAIADAIGIDSRIGRKFLNAGIGFGGGCLPKDIRAFQASAEDLGLRSLDFLSEVDRINRQTRTRMAELIASLAGGQLAGARVGVLGLSFKPDSDDIRESASIAVIDELVQRGAAVRAADPQAAAAVAAIRPNIEVADSWRSAVDGADVVAVLTEWPEYRALQPADLESRVTRRLIADGRNCLSPSDWLAAGWTYGGLGRGILRP